MGRQTERLTSPRMHIAILKTLTREDREDTIAQLWNNKMQRDPEQLGGGIGSPTSEPGWVSPTEGGSPVLHRLAGSFDSDISDLDTSFDDTNERGRSIFKRIVRRLSGSRSTSRATNSSPIARNGNVSRPTLNSRIQSERSTLARSSSNSSKSTSDHSSNSSTARSWHSAGTMATAYTNASRPQALTRPSLLSITNPIITNDSVPQRVKKVSYKHGPTMSAKRGIELEWDGLKMKGDWDYGTGVEDRRLGHQLLMSQLSSKVGLRGQTALSTPAIVDMLVMRWTTSPTHRRESYLGVSSSSASASNAPSQATFNFFPDNGPAERMREESTATGMRRQVTV
jgi:hypothetical protein